MVGNENAFNSSSVSQVILPSLVEIICDRTFINCSILQLTVILK